MSNLMVIFTYEGNPLTMQCKSDDVVDNVFQKYADYYSYYYGNSRIYTRENIHLMKRFYLNFPIFTFSLNSITWEQYQVILIIQNKKERFFYFSLSLFFHSDLYHTKELIANRYYYRI